MAQLKLFLFGTPRIAREAVEISFRRRKALALLSFLAMKKQPQNRDKLCTLLWSDFDTERARNNLRRELSLLNSTLGESIFDADRIQIRLNSESDLWLDVDEYWTRVRMLNSHTQHLNPSEIMALEEAVTLYHDDFMAGFGLSDSPLFDEWQFFETENLRRSYALVLQALVQHYGEQKDYMHAIEYCHRWIAIDPLHEPAQRQVMKFLAWSGQYSAALHQYEICVNLLEQELGVVPEEQTQALYDVIRTRQLLSSETEGHLAPHTDVQPTHNLPMQVTLFMGRQQEQATLEAWLLNPQSRLITIWGPGGIGKTRLASEVALQQVANFQHGVYFIDLASLSSSEHIVSTIADIISFTIQPDERDPKHQLLEYLESKTMLLVIDNCEHLLSDMTLISDILRQDPNIKIMATSRETLKLVGETLLPLDGLDFDTTETILTSSAGQLFIHTAQRIRPTFSPHDFGALLQVCKITQGMPLAIILAATWVVTLTLPEIIAEMEQSLAFLDTDIQDVPERHQSILAVMDSTWARLSPTEQQILMTCSLFRGGFTREALQKITGATLRQQASLTNKALLKRDPDTGRYGIHELLRQYAEDQLKRSNRVDDAHHHHAMYYLTWLSNLEDDIKGRRQVAAFNEFEADLENIRLAWEWGITTQNYEAVNLAIGSIYHFFDMQTRHSEGINWLQLALDKMDSVAQSTYEIVYVRLDLRLLSHQFQLYQLPDDVLDRLNRYLSIAETRQDHTEIGFCLLIIAYVHAREDVQNLIIKTLYEDSISHFKKAGDLYFASNSLHGLAFYQCELCGQIEIGIQNFKESLKLSRQVGDLNITLWSLIHIAFRIPFKNLTEINQYLIEAIDLSNGIGSRWGSGLAYIYLAISQYHTGDFDSAQMTIEQGLVGLQNDASVFEINGLCLRSQMATVAEVDYEKSRELAVQAKLLSADFDSSWHSYYIPFALVDIATHDYESARQYLDKALLHVSEYTMNICGEILCISGMILAHEDKKERAVELFSLIFNHPDSTTGWIEKWALFHQVNGQLKVDLSEDKYSVAWERGKLLDVKIVINDLRIEFDYRHHV